MINLGLQWKDLWRGIGSKGALTSHATLKWVITIRPLCSIILIGGIDRITFRSGAVADRFLLLLADVPAFSVGCMSGTLVGGM